WENDALGVGLAERLAARAGPHLRVRVLIDGGGNLIFGQPEGASAAEVNGALARLLRHPHVEVVRIRNPFARFDHRKLVLIAGRVAWTGGRTFDLPAFFSTHDVSFTLEGPLVTELQERFEDHWRDHGGSSGGGPPAPAPTPPVANAAARLIHT